MHEEFSFNPQILIPDFEIRAFNIVIDVAGPTVDILPAEANRVALVWFRMPAVAFVAPITTPRAGTGWGLSDTIAELPVPFFYRDWGSMVGYPWEGFTVFAPAIFQGIEIIYRPEK